MGPTTFANEETLAILCCTCTVAATRRMVEHEERAVGTFDNRLEHIVNEICDVLLDEGQLKEDLTTSARTAVSYMTIDEAAEAYRSSWGTILHMEHLLPLGTLLCILRSNGSLVRSSLKKAAEAVEALRSERQGHQGSSTEQIGVCLDVLFTRDLWYIVYKQL